MTTISVLHKITWELFSKYYFGKFLQVQYLNTLKASLQECTIVAIKNKTKQNLPKVPKPLKEGV